MTNSEARKRHATPPTPDALDAIRARLAEVEAHRDLLLKGFFASCPDAHEHGVWCGSAWVAMEARATAAESARDAAEGAIERVRALYGPLVPRASVAGSPYSTGRWEAFAEVRNILDSTPANDAAEVEDGVFGDMGIHARLTIAALAPVTTDETEGGAES